MSPLSTGDVSAGGRDGEAGDFVIVAAEEVLGPRNDISHNNGGAEGVYNVLSTLR